MSDLIELKLATEGEAECLHRLQVEAFMPLYENVNWISPIFIIPKFQNKGIASAVIEQLFDIYPNTIEWRLDTIKQEIGNCHLYEKCGFVRVGGDIVVNEKMTLVDYVKNCIRVRRFEEEDADEVGKLIVRNS